MDFTKFNSGTNAFAGLNIKLEEIENAMSTEQLFNSGNTYKVMAIMFSTKGEYGKSAFLVCADAAEKPFTMWLPKHMLETCEQMVQDKECVEGILAGRCGVKGVKYTDKKGKDRYTVEWENI